MKQFLYLLFPFLFFSNSVFSYEPELVLDYSCRPAISPFAKVQVVDCRSIPYMHYSGNSAINPEYNGSITDSIAQFFLPADQPSGPNTELKVFLYNLQLTESNDVGEPASMHISMRFFYNAGLNQFNELPAFDTVYSMDDLNANKLLLLSISGHLCEIASGVAILKQIPGARSYTPEEMDHLDSIEKLQIPIYNAENINEGIYKNYEDFKQNRPVKEKVYIDTTDRGSVIANIITPKGKKWIRKKDSVYIISNSVLSAINIEGKFYLIKKEQSDYCFYINDVDYTNSAKAGSVFGLAGAIVATAADMNDIYINTYKIDYYSGNPILISITKTTRKDRKKKN
jgi:hypothetical protein